MYCLERFLNSCMRSDELRTCKHLKDFLSMDDEKLWRAKQKETDKLPAHARLQEYPSAKGQLTLDTSPGLSTFAQNAMSLTIALDPIYKKIGKLVDELIREFEQISGTLSAMSECYQTIYNEVASFNKSTEFGQSQRLEDTIAIIHNTIISWGDSITVRKSLVQNHMDCLNMSAKYENRGYQEILKQRTTVSDEYEKASKALLEKKNKLFASGDISKWEVDTTKHDKSVILKNRSMAFDLMLPKDTGNVEEHKELSAYFNYQASAEITRCLEESNKSYRKVFCNLAKEAKQYLSTQQTAWDFLLTQFSDTSAAKKGIGLHYSKQVSKSEGTGFIVDEA